jgi:hypothetical protein
VSIDNQEPTVLEVFRRNAPHDVRVIVWIDGIEAEALIVDDAELENNNAIVMALYARAIGEVQRRKKDRQEQEDLARFRRNVAESTSGRHRVVTVATLEEAMTPPDATQMMQALDPAQWPQEDYNTYMFRVARWTRWLNAEPEPTIDGYPMTEVEAYVKWRDAL